MTFLQLVGNIVWILLGGLISALEYLPGRNFACITIVAFLSASSAKIATIRCRSAPASSRMKLIVLNYLMNLL